ncbi:MAG: hypothetical protein K8F27_06865, partial [Sulfuricellaceae bacterium]|nr:hypothetical protein [Sulfuricellaceae bacterium]
MKTRASAFLFLFALLLSSPLLAAWTSVSSAKPLWLAGGSGSSLFAAETGALYASADSGKTWQALAGPGISGPYSVLSFTNNQVWVGTQAQGAAYSGNSGGSWTTSNSGMLNPLTKVAQMINAISTVPASATQLVAAMNSGVYISADGGGTWKTSLQGLPSIAGPLPGTQVTTPVYDVAGAAGGVFAATDTGVYRSNDGGATWAVQGLSGSKVSRLSASGSDVYAVVDGVGLYKYSGSGSWVQLTGIPAVPFTVLAHP